MLSIFYFYWRRDLLNFQKENFEKIGSCGFCTKSLLFFWFEFYYYSLIFQTIAVYMEIFPYLIDIEKQDFSFLCFFIYGVFFVFPFLFLWFGLAHTSQGREGR